MIADRCFRTALISLIVAPDRRSASVSTRLSASVTGGAGRLTGTAHEVVATGSSNSGPSGLFTDPSLFGAGSSPGLLFESSTGKGGDITLEVTAEFSLLGDDRAVSGGENPLTVPTFLTRNVTNVIRLRDGETGLIGGLVEDSETESLSGALGVASIPIIGSLFGNNSQRDEEREAALALLKDPDLLSRIERDLTRCGVVGEATNKLVGYLAVLSRKLDAPLAVTIQSTSAAGKSVLMDAVLGFVPLLLLQQSFALGAGVALGVVNVFFRDVAHAIAVLLQFWFWFTPIVYPLGQLEGRVRFLITLNPMTNLDAGGLALRVAGREAAGRDRRRRRLAQDRAPSRRLRRSDSA